MRNQYCCSFLFALAVLFTVAPREARSQCATLPAAYDPIVATPPANPCCPGFVYLAYCSASIGGGSLVNDVTNTVVWSGNMNGCGAGGHGCGGGCYYNMWDLPPGQYRFDVGAAWGGETCTSFYFTVPAYEPGDEIQVDLGTVDLPSEICGTGYITVGFELPNTQCLPAPTARLEHDMGNIPGVLIAPDTFAFSGVPPSSQLVAWVSAGCLSTPVEVPVEEVPCPPLGGEPATQDATACSAGRISGTIPPLACAVAVAVVSVQSGEPVTVVWDNASTWHASVPAGQYAVAMGVGASGACMEEYVVEVGLICPGLGGTPATQDATPSAAGRISGTVPQLGCPVVVAVVAVAGGASMTVVWENATHWSASVPAGQYAVAIGAGAGGACMEEYVVEVEQGSVPCTAVVIPTSVTGQSVFGVANGSATIHCTVLPDMTDAVLQLLDNSGTLIASQPVEPPSATITFSDLRSATYTLRVVSVEQGCSSESTVTVPCAAERSLFADTDNDGWGDLADRIRGCNPVQGYVLDSLDCDVDQPNAAPGVLYSYDGDGDHWFVSQRVYCGVPPANYVPVSEAPNGVDCNDGDPVFWGPIGTPCQTCGPCEENCTVRAECGCSGDPRPDTDEDGVCNAQDNCPNTPGQINSACDDHNALTTDDRLTDACLCAGVCPNGSRVGSNCDDNDPCSPQSVWNANCECEGTVPQGTGPVGANCDDQDDNTTNDVWNSSCSCEGTPCNPALVMSLSIWTDAHGDQIAWYLRDNTSNEIVCSGDELPDNTTVERGCCLIAGRCYKLTVTDSGGDGIIRGGYVVRKGGTSGQRLIDNRGNFRVPGPSTINGAESFCWEMGSTSLLDMSCDRENWLKDQHLLCTEHPMVSAAWVNGAPNASQSADAGYEFWFFDPNGSFNMVYFRSHRMVAARTEPGPLRATHFPINSWTNSGVSPHIPGNRLLNVRVRARYPGSDLPFGPACRFMLDPSREECPVSSLIDDPSNVQHSCNVQRARRGPLDLANRVYALPIHHDLGERSNRDRYQFRFRNEADNFERIMTVDKNYVALAWRDVPLVVGRTYEVDVRTSTDDGATWCVGEAVFGGPYVPWGPVCSVTIIESSGMAEDPRSFTTHALGDAEFTLYPNPNNGSQVLLSLYNVPHMGNTAGVLVHDPMGRQVYAGNVPTQDGTINHTLDFGSVLSAGVYLVQLSVAGQLFTERMVVQP